jgi:hypothetical protein
MLILLTVGRTLGQRISPSLGRYLHRTIRHRRNADIHTSSGKWTHGLIVWAGRTLHALDRVATVIVCLILNDTSLLAGFAPLFGECFFPLSVQIRVSVYIWVYEGGMGLARVEAGSNTSTVALRVVGGDEKGIRCLGDINTGIWPSRLGSLESETVKCGHESRGTRTWEWVRWRGPAAIVNDRPMLSSERMLHKD